MPPQTRSSTRPSAVTTRASSARTQASKKVEAPKVIPKPSKEAKVAPKTKPKPKSKPQLTAKPKAKAEQGVKPARKRARKTDPKGEVQASETFGTTLLINLPIEVLIEIAHYVHPLDLIMLSRVNKFFRDLFMDKRSAMIWRSAQENLPGLPPCPEEVSEPQYAAMLFAKRCSSCGGYAPREMNPVLMIRLCSYCWGEELVDVMRVTDSSLVSRINAPVPGQSHRWKSWCLYREAREVKAKLNELTEAGDEEALQTWKAERHKLVAARRLNSEPLSNWLAERERKRVRDRDELKVVNRKEIESRLIKLGWEKGDFVCYDRWRRKQWNNMVYTTKTLSDKVWDNLLPRLLGHLELNREQRLEREKDQRRSARRSTISGWFSAIRGQLPDYARVTVVQGGHPEAEGTTSAPTDIWSVYGRDPSSKFLQAFPLVSQACEWPEYTTLIDNDVPHEQFMVDFEGRKPEFEQSIASWKHELEAHLVATVPDDTHPPNFDVPPLTMTVGTGEDVQPIGMLPEDIQRLLRADTIFTISPLGDHSRLYFYPHNFSQFGTELTNTIFYSQAHEIAKALLSVLGVPDASYLSLRALGKNFRCGRCPQASATGMYWSDLIKHYLDSIRSWKAVIRQRQVRSNKNFVYVCTHDIDVENPERPLVHMSESTQANGQANNHPWAYSTCILCYSLNLHCSMPSQVVVDHVRDVHLVEEPEAGVHYRNM